MATCRLNKEGRNNHQNRVALEGIAHGVQGAICHSKQSHNLSAYTVLQSSFRFHVIRVEHQGREHQECPP